MFDYPRPATKKVTQKILNQMTNSIFKIKENEGEINFCYFCYIKYQGKDVPVVIVNNCLSGDDLGNKLIINMNGRAKEIELGKTRYLNKEFNISIIEIKEKKIKNINFIELDDILYENEPEMFFQKKSIYVIQYDTKKEILVSYGMLDNLNKDKIIYSCNINKEYKYSLIFNLVNNKLIGFHDSKSNDKHKEILFKYTISEFINRYKINLKRILNEIDILIKIDKEDVNKKIYFLDNYHDNLKELNELNTELYINGKIYKYNKYFIPDKEGEYSIKLKFFNNLTDCSYMFAGCKNIININFIYFNTINITNMEYMFYKCNNLKEINNLSSFDTKNVTEYELYVC